MPNYRLLLLSIFLIFNILTKTVSACGYSFIGECSTGIHLRINNTLDSFTVSECSFGKKFQGLNLGTIQSLNLAKATAITWESCDNNVSGVGLYYRVYEQGMPSGNWSILPLPEDFNQLEGPYTARYRSQFSNANLVSGLTTGKTYVMEIYFLAQVDTVGNDFIPETTMIQNNDGQNYQLTFKYGGATAPPFTVVTTQLTGERCPGDSTGTAGVTVYGNQSGLFYQWSNVNNNFNTLYELAAGTYTVTVSGSSGYTQSQTMTVLQPDPIGITFTDIQTVACGNTPGSASAVVSGGTAPFSYLWETGETDSIASIPLPGNWQLSITDANGCTASASAQVGGSSILERNLVKTICQGSSFILGDQTFDTAGDYNLLVNGNGSCDTLFFLTVVVLDPGIALTGIPEQSDLTCISPTLTLCAEVHPGISYEWKKEGVILSTSPCLNTNQGGPHSIFATLQQSGQTCIAAKTVQISLHTDAPVVQISGVASFTDCTSSTATIVLTAQTNAVAPTYEWKVNGSVVATGNTYTLTVDNPLNFTPPDLVVTNQYGCQGTSSGISLVITQPVGAPMVTNEVIPASGESSSDGVIDLSVVGGQPPYSFAWEDGNTDEDRSGLLPGDYCYTVSDAAGCVSIGCVQVSWVFATEDLESGNIRLYPNPARAGSALQLDFSKIVADQFLEVALYNLQGQIVAKEIHSASPASIYISLPAELPAGPYCVRVKTGKSERFFHLSIF